MCKSNIVFSVLVYNLIISWTLLVFMVATKNNCNYCFYYSLHIVFSFN